MTTMTLGRASTHVRVPSAPPALLALAAMLSVELAGGLSVGLFAQVGPAGVAWLRLCIAAPVMALIARPRLRGVSRRALAGAGWLGLASAVMTVGYFEAIARIPLATAVSIELLGPLAVAVARRDAGRRALALPLLALAGVLLMTQPWHTSGADPVGLAMAAAAALGCGGYVVLTQRVGDDLPGLSGLALSLPVAAVVAGFAGAPQAIGHLDAAVLLKVAGLAVLLPLLPYALEMKALRRMTTSSFGTLMALEPGMSLLVGVVVLSQLPGVLQGLGLLLVIAAGLASQRSGRRPGAGEGPTATPVVPRPGPASDPAQRVALPVA